MGAKHRMVTRRGRSLGVWKGREGAFLKARIVGHKDIANPCNPSVFPTRSKVQIVQNGCPRPWSDSELALSNRSGQGRGAFSVRLLAWGQGSLDFASSHWSGKKPIAASLARVIALATRRSICLCFHTKPRWLFRSCGQQRWIAI